jgi:hypothetical protein
MEMKKANRSLSFPGQGKHEEVGTFSGKDLEVVDASSGEEFKKFREVRWPLFQERVESCGQRFRR